MTLTDNPGGLLHAALQSEAAGRLDEAEQFYHQLLQHPGSAHCAWQGLGLLAVRRGNLVLAARHLENAVGAEPEQGVYWRNLGEVQRRLGALDQAIVAGEHATRLMPANVDAHYNLGLAFGDAGRYDEAIPYYRQALELNPQHGMSWNNLGSALEKRDQPGDKAAAKAAYERAVALDPAHAEAHNNLGAIQSEQGLLEEARASFEAAIAQRPEFVEAHFNYSSLHRYTPGDPHLAMLEGVAARAETLSEHASIRYHFALAKALDDTGQYDRAFASYERGNRLQHAAQPCNEQRADALMARIIEVFDNAFFAERAGWQGVAAGERVPVFIVGMPRSGTTLLEQILCSHPRVHGAGELVELNAAIMAASPPGHEGTLAFCEGARLLSEADIQRIGRDYLERVWQLSPDSQYITDKMPANFFYLGILHLALPGAKIIHSMRDPMDSCFSCYTRLFNQTMTFAYDQGTLGRYYVRYRTLMNHWHSVLPAGRILDLAYEDMVADPEKQARRVLEFVGLPWDEGCLKFHENTRLVKTASVAQVRQPIYTSSVARWKHFAAHLRPLYSLVREWRSANDAAEVDALMARQSAEELHNAGIALYRQDRFSEALHYYDRALALKPAAPAMLNSKGFVLQDLGRLREAHACFAKAVELAPTFAMARLNLALAQLKLGDWAAGWANYEARWEGAAEAGQQRYARQPCPLPQWDGQAETARQGILVITEQGFGDTFQFVRLLSGLVGRFQRVGFVCSLPTLRLMEWSFSDQVAMFYEMPTDFTAWDWQCPLMSLPRALGLRPDNVPAQAAYLRVPQPSRDHWSRRLQARAPGRLRVGIAWSGRANYQYNSRRSLAFERLQPLLADPRVAWVSLQKWLPDETPPALPDSVDWIDWTAQLSDFASTAALVANLDLVISVDSVIVHLAGALDVPVWMLDRFDNEWRWLNGRSDSPWYPRLRIFRQPAFGEWAPVIDAVRQALAGVPVPSTAGGTVAAEAPAVAAPVYVDMHKAMQLAGQLETAGRGQEAEALLRQVIEHHPGHAHALHLLGVVLYQGGKRQEAIEYVAQAVAAEPGVALFHSNLAEMHRQAGQLQAAIEHGEQAVALDPAMASAFSNLGVAYYDAKAYEQARASHEKALALVPTLIHSLNNLGSLERALKRPDAAIAYYRQVLEIHPQYVETMSNLGAVLVEEDRVEEAAALLEKALAIDPRACEVMCNLGLVRLKQERAEDALQLMSRSLNLRPDYPEALIGLGRCLSELDKRKEGLEALRRATVVAPDKPEAWCHFAALAMEQGESALAEASYGKALELDPEMVDALTGLGNLRLEEGNAEEALRLTEQAIALAPDHLGARFHLVQVRKVKPGDPNLAALEALAASDASISNARQISLHYALGKAYDDLGDYSRAFTRFMEGARIKRASLNYNAEAEAERVRAIIAQTSAGFLDGLRGSASPSELPVFVLGMPRSGTTLTEQIIASHPEVYGAGELQELMEIVQREISGQPWQPYPANLAGLTPHHVKAMGEEYVTRLQRRAPGKKRITDKMPANYMALGLIPLMVPGARIIHVRRNPVDTCVSCFTRLFNRHQEATYDLRELGGQYVNYMKLMEHWRAVLPAGSFIEVQYEDIVADMETQARRLIAYCGLPWNDACLAFYKTPRNVRTASVTQVRQPIYTSSVERWRNYEGFLAPLLDALGAYGPGR